jgi:hypothetical protein
LVVPWYQLDLDVTDPALWSVLETRYGREGVDREFLVWFAREFEPLGGISAPRFQDNVRWLAGAIPTEARLIFLNGAEVPLDNPREPARHLRHQIMNASLDQVTSGLANAAVCDVRTFVLSEDDLTDSIRHYQRRSYVRMAEEIRAVSASDLMVRRPPLTSRAFTALYNFAGRRRVQGRRLSRRLRGASSGRPS